MAIEDHPNYGNIHTLVNSLINIVESNQARFYVLYSKYFQGLRIPEIGENEDGTLVDSDKLDGIRTEKINIHLQSEHSDEDWGDFDGATFKVNVKLPVHVSTMIYHFPNGEWGWDLIVEFWYPGIGPDIFGHSTDHWMFKHHGGYGSPPGVYDIWYCKKDGDI